MMNKNPDRIEILEHRAIRRRPTQRAPDGWESPRFQAVCVAGGWFR